MNTFLEVLGIIGRVLGWIGIGIAALILIILFLCLFPLRLNAEWDRGEIRADAGFLFINKRLLPQKKDEKESGRKEKEKKQETSASVERPARKEEAPAEPQTAPQAKKDPLPEEKAPPVDKDPLPAEDAPPADRDPLPPEPDEFHAEKEGKDTSGDSGGLMEFWDRIEPLIYPGTRAVRHITRHVHIKDLSVRMESVASDAAVVGMLTGAKWAFLGNASAVLDASFGSVRYGKMEVVPCWTKDMSQGERAAVKVRFRPIFVLGAGMIFLAGWLRSRLKRKKKASSEE